MDVLLKCGDDIYDIVNNAEIRVGDTFFDAMISDPPKRIIREIIEQRPEYGEYKDESNRRMWASVKSEIVP